MERKAVLLLYEHIETMRELTDEEFGRIVRALYRYERDHTEPAFADRAMRMMWSSLKAFDDVSYQNMQEKSRARSEAGKKGMARRWGITADNQAIAAVTGGGTGNISASGPVSASASGSVSGEGAPGTGPADACPAPPPAKAARFHPPELDEVRTCFAEKGSTAEQAERFFAYYESNGWRVGRNPMKNWKAAASGWLARERELEPKRQPAKGAPAPYNVDDVLTRALRSLDEEYEVIG